VAGPPRPLLLSKVARRQLLLTLISMHGVSEEFETPLRIAPFTKGTQLS
jgi:hypothetical protein